MKQYLALTVGTGAAATSAEGATVQLFDESSQPTWIQFTDEGKANKEYVQLLPGQFMIGESMFSRGADLTATGSSSFQAKYFQDGSFRLGAQSGSGNYANLQLNGQPGYEAVGQFYFDGAGGGYLVALASNDDGSALSISAGKAAIDAAGVSAVPEPTSHLSLLALGASGLLLRRRAKRAA